MGEGIVVGLAVAGSIWLLKFVFLGGIVPLVQHMAYGGIKIEGTWKTQLGPSPYAEKVVLKRFDHKVWGTITVQSSPSGADINKTYKFRGFFKNGFLNCHYEIKDRSLFDTGNFVLRQQNGGIMLDGFSISYYDPENTLKALRYSWDKVNIE